MATQKNEVTIRTRNLVINPLLCRKQFIVDIYHPGIAQPAFPAIKAQIAKMYKVQDPQTIILSGFATKFGGGKTSGFGVIYDTLAAAKKFLPRFVLAREGHEVKAKTPRKARKEFKKKWRMCHSFRDYKKKEMKKASRKKK